MKARSIVGVLVLVATCTAGVYAASGEGAAPIRQWAIVQLQKPTLISGTFVMGTVMFLHDDSKMAKGEPCTEVYRFEPGKGPTELVTAFHCTPKNRDVAGTFRMSTRNAADGTARLTEYQFAGDAEGHGVPETDAAPAPAPKTDARAQCPMPACCN